MPAVSAARCLDHNHLVAPKNLISAESISKAFGHRPLLDKVSLGVAEGDRIGVVGRNGAGKSTLIKILAGLEPADAGRVATGADGRIGDLGQRDPFGESDTVESAVTGGAPHHQWATDANVRTVMTALLGGFNDRILSRSISGMSGGERRRVDLARLLVSDLDVLLLDEPTNHLDVDVIAWLAQYLKSRTRLSIIVVTHDRWFLDEVCDAMWEVVDGSVEEYEGGYSAFVLAKAERQRQSRVEESRRNNLIRKELAWLRRGAPARTTKPKFRIDAANELIAAEPPPRDSAQLLAFANARLGKTVFEVQDVQMSVAGRVLIDHLTWSVAPGGRIGILGVNGAGKTSLVRLLLGELAPTGGKLVTGTTVKVGYLSQHLEELDPTWRTLEAVERIANRVELGSGKELTASQLCERLGFGPDAQWTPVGDLSGGERRRLQLTRLLMSAPNVLVLDEPTNDFDTETLAALEDLLDSFGGTLLVISHDRFFLERVCDNFHALLGDAALRELTGGIDQYLELHRALPPSTARTAAGDHRAADSANQASTGAHASPGAANLAESSTPMSAAQQRLNAKEMSKLERQIAKLDAQATALHAQLAEHATDFERVSALNDQLRAVQTDLTAAEEAWLALAE